MYAVIQTGGKQYRVAEGDTIEVERLPETVGQEVRFEEVLLLGKDDDTIVGKPTVPGASVVGKVVFAGRAPKIIVYKIKRRKNVRKKSGHRQQFSRVQVQSITVG